MADGLDDSMNSGRAAPIDGGYRDRDPDEALPVSDDDTSSDTHAASDGQTPLTHRPRKLAQLNPTAIKTATGRSPSERTDNAGAPPHHAAPKAYEAPHAEEASPTDLRPFADQLIAIAERLKSAEFGEGPTPHPLSPIANDAADTASTEAAAPTPDAADLMQGDTQHQRKTFAEMARLSYAKRRKRVAIFGDPELFGEPAWDILLDLYIAQAEDKTVSVSSACIGSASPPTTGLRWLGVLADQGLLEREHDPLDQRRVLVRLTDKALEAMDGYFAASAGMHTDRRASRA
ncbi:MAG: winged helix DNA-binding protein [Pseudomonadota bacterium]